MNKLLRASTLLCAEISLECFFLHEYLFNWLLVDDKSLSKNFRQPADDSSAVITILK